MKQEDMPRIRKAMEIDISVINKLITDWLKFDVGREVAIGRAIENEELLIAEDEVKVVGFIHYVMHEDIIDGGTNSFITAFYVIPALRNRGVGSRLLQAAIEDSLERGALEVETSTADPEARRFYEKHHFEQFMGEWAMGEVFLELNVPKYKAWLRAKTG